MKNKKGLTLVELIGAIVVFGILITLSITVIDYFSDANNRASISSQANFEGLLAIRTIKNSVDDLEPTSYDECTNSNCVIIQSEYKYEYDEVSNDIELVEYDTPLEYRIEIVNNVLYINNEEYVFTGFELTDSSTLTYEEIASELFLTVTLYLYAGDEFIYDFVLSYSFDLTDIPTT